MAAAQLSGVCTASGVVTAAEAGRIEIELQPPPRCQGCNGACRWYGETAARHLTIATRHVFTVGARVTVGVSDRELLRGAAIVYGLPLAALVCGAVLGFAVWGSDVGTAAGAGVAIAVALIAAWGLRARLERRAGRAITVVPAS